MDFDSIIIGAGIVGLAIARAIARSGRQVLVLEAQSQPGTETSARNSEVIHAGIYYPQNSLKARLCLRGRELLYQYCETHKVACRRIGKLIVATGPGQLPTLKEIYRQGLANGVADLQLLGQQELAELEPELNALAAIHSPSTGIIDSHGLLTALLGDLEAAGGILCCQSPVNSIHRQSGTGTFMLQVGGREPTSVTCRELINCAGHGAQALSHGMTGASPGGIPPRYYSRGCYFTVARRLPFDHLIYPVPGDAGLGIHLTLDLAGAARFGPDSEWVDRLDYRVDPARGDAFYQAIRRYYPGLRDGELAPGYAGVRPKVTGPGEPAGDFMIHGSENHGIPGYVALYGIESPGLTASLAIAEYVNSQILHPPVVA